MRTRELAQSVEELKALGEVSQAVGSTLDLETVLTSIVRHAVQLSKTDAGTIYEFDEVEGVFVPRINYGAHTDLIEALRKSRLRVGDRTAIGQAAVKRTAVQIPDLAEAPDYFTDGVIEAENEEKELFGNERLVGFLKDSSGPPWGKGLLDFISKWQGNSSASDDLTILEIWRDIN